MRLYSKDPNLIIPIIQISQLHNEKYNDNLINVADMHISQFNP